MAQASLSFEWQGDRDTPEATEAFVRYARARVKGAMLDELRQMDHLGRSQRRKIKVLQIARERFAVPMGTNPAWATEPTQRHDIDEIAALEQADRRSPEEQQPGFGALKKRSTRRRAATPRDEVEARVDTAIVLRRLETFFAACRSASAR